MRANRNPHTSFATARDCAKKCVPCDDASIAVIISNQSAETRAFASPVVVIAGISNGIGFFLNAMHQDASRIRSGGSLSEAESKYGIA
jgi:hypothetical protein